MHYWMSSLTRLDNAGPVIDLGWVKLFELSYTLL